MKITINYNNDMIMINPDERYEESEVEYDFSSLRNGRKIQSLLEEIFNRLDVRSNNLNVELEKLDEDNRTTIGEW